MLVAPYRVADGGRHGLGMRRHAGMCGEFLSGMILASLLQKRTTGEIEQLVRADLDKEAVI